MGNRTSSHETMDDNHDSYNQYFYRPIISDDTPRQISSIQYRIMEIERQQREEKLRWEKELYDKKQQGEKQYEQDKKEMKKLKTQLIDK